MSTVEWTCNRPLPTSLGLATSLVEGGALMWDSPSVVAGEEGLSSPVPNDLRGRHPHHSGAGLLWPVIPATCATVSLVIGTAAPKKVYRIASQMPEATLSVSRQVGFLPGLLASCFRAGGSPRAVRPGAPPRKMLNDHVHRAYQRPARPHAHESPSSKRSDATASTTAGSSSWSRGRYSFWNGTESATVVHCWK